MTIPAKSVMTTDIVTVPPETTVAETARRMLIHHVSAVPVVDPHNRPLGSVALAGAAKNHEQAPTSRLRQRAAFSQHAVE